MIGAGLGSHVMPSSVVRRLGGTVIALLLTLVTIAAGAPGASTRWSGQALPASTSTTRITIYDGSVKPSPATFVVDAHADASIGHEARAKGISSRHTTVFVAAEEAAGAGQGFRSFSAFKRAEGAAGEGMQWHHVVEQTPGNVETFGAGSIHNTSNLVRLDVATHRQISGYYSSIQPSFTGGQTVRKWLSTQPYEFQQQFGWNVLRQFGAAP